MLTTHRVDVWKLYLVKDPCSPGTCFGTDFTNFDILLPISLRFKIPPNRERIFAHTSLINQFSSWLIMLLPASSLLPSYFQTTLSLFQTIFQSPLSLAHNLFPLYSHLASNLLIPAPYLFLACSAISQPAPHLLSAQCSSKVASPGPS